MIDLGKVKLAACEAVEAQGELLATLGFNCACTPHVALEMVGEIERLRELCSEVYVVCGALDANETVLDNLYAGAKGEPLPNGTLLPYFVEGKEYTKVKCARIGEPSEDFVGSAKPTEPSSGTCWVGYTKYEGLEVAKLDVPTVWASTPTNFRLARKPDGELILQGEYQWHHGFNEYGSEWRDLETVGWEKENGQD